MADDEKQSPFESGENTMLVEAIEAIRTGDLVRARDLLTRLIKLDQKNASYWLWLSTAVETKKERIYCLQTAIQIDPQNAAAKRGLILFGALPPDDSVPPFPVNRPRLWEEKLLLPKEPREKLRGWSNPVTRLFIALGISILVLGLFVGGYMLFSRNAKPSTPRFATRYMTATITRTPTATPIPSTPTAIPTLLGPTPLWMFLSKTYTPTPLYVLTPHPITSRSAFQSGLRFLAVKDYTNALVLFQQAQDLEPNAPDIDYYIGEVYRAQSNLHAAQDQYQKAINKDPNFAPPFLRRAQINLALNPKADVSKDLDEAIYLDPHFAEAHIERGKYRLPTDPAAAESDFEAAVENTPNSALAYLYLSQAQLALGENVAALESAQRANQIDITLIPAYLALAQAYIVNGQSELAVVPLQTYTIFEPDDTSAFLSLGTAYNAAGQYQDAVDILTKAIQADRRNAKAYSQRSYAYFNLQKASLAEADIRLAIIYNPSDFDSQLALARILDMEKKPGDAYMQIEQKVHPMAKTDATKAQVYYWEALYLEEIGDPLSAEGATNAWYQLIALPEDAMPAEWRDQAFEHLKITPTFTPTLFPTITPTFTPTLDQTDTPTQPETPTSTPVPVETASPTATPFT